MIGTNGREEVSVENICILNKIPWDRKHYANFKFADGKYGLEISYYLDNVEYRYKVICKDHKHMQRLRAELDENSVLRRVL